MSLTFTTGNAFSNGDSATSTKLNNMVNLATYAGTLEVAAGGSGAATLTGYVKGNGTSAFTASSTVPGTDISGNISGNAANVTGTVLVANGGTGATTLSAGYVKSNGASAFTSASAVPASDLSGTVGLANGGTGTTTGNLARVAINRGTSALTDGASIATDASLSNVFTVTLGGNRTLANPTNLVAGATYIWIITQDGTGSRTLAYGSAFKWPSGVAPTLTTGAGAVDTITAVYNGSILISTAIFDAR